MAHAVGLTDGTTTISLSSSGCILTRYAPAAAGWDVKTAGWGAVTETVEFVVVAASGALVQAALRAIEQLLGQGLERAEGGTGPIVYLTFQPDGDVAYRAEVLGWRLEADEGAAEGFGQGLLPMRLHVTRAGLWLGARTQLALTNGNGAGNTSGLLVWNHDDATSGHDHYVEIAGSAVGGSAAVPLELQLISKNGSLTYYDDLFVANNPYGTGLGQVLDTDVAVGGYGTVTASGSAANGYYLSLTGSGWLTFRWTVAAATLNLLRGRHVRVIAKFFSVPSSVRETRLTVYDWGGLTPLTTAEVAYTLGAGAAYLHDCGSVPLPPAKYASGWKDVVLELKVKTSGSETMGVDFVTLMPCERGHFRHLMMRGGIEDGESVVDDGIEGVVYASDGSSLKYPLLVERTGPLLVWPGVTQRLYVLQDGYGATIDWKMHVKAWYRPGRITF